MFNTIQIKRLFSYLWVALAATLAPVSAKAIDFGLNGDTIYRVKKFAEEKTEAIMGSGAETFDAVGYSIMLIGGFIMVILLVFFLFMLIRKP